MTKWIAAFGCVLALVCLFAAPSLAQEKQTITGTVSVTTDDDDNIVGVSIVTADDDVIRVTLDAKGKELGQKCSGKKVSVTGAVAEKDDDMWMTVESYKEAGGEEE